MWEEGQGDATRRDEECVQTLQQPFKCTVINSTDDWLRSTTCSFTTHIYSPVLPFQDARHRDGPEAALQLPAHSPAGSRGQCTR